MKISSKLYRPAALVILSLFIFIAALFLSSPFFGLPVLGLYLWLFKDGYRSVLIKIFNFNNSTRTNILAIFFCWVIVGFFAGIAIVAYRLNAGMMSLVFFAAGALSIWLEKWTGQIKHVELTDDTAKEPVIEFAQKRTYLWAYLVFVIFGFILLWQSRSGDPLITPWQIISKNYIYMYFLSVLTLGGLFFSKIKTNTIILLVILQFFLTVAFLPATHKLFYGADGWRHIAVEQQIIDGDRVNVQNFGGSLVARLNPGLFSYSQFWGSQAILARLTNIDLTQIMAWMQPVIWPVIFVLLALELGLFFGWGQRKSLIFSYLCLWPFALIAAGSFSLPVNYGFLVWLFLFLLILKRFEEPRVEQKYLLYSLGVLSLFGYALYFILFWLGWGMIEFLKFARSVPEKISEKYALAAAFIAGSLAFPFIELVSGYSKIDLNLNFLASAKQAIGNFLSLYLASGPRLHIIETGNVFFNQIPAYAFVPNGFTSWRWWIIGLMVLVVIGCVYGFLSFWRDKEIPNKFIAIFSFGIFAGYFICRYLLAGEHILSRRLEAVFAFLALVLLFSAINKYFSQNRFATILIILISATAITASYSLGPLARAIDIDSYNATKFVAEKISNDKKSCVVSDTYTLLALEANTAKKVIGGGFPISADFSQPDLVILNQQMNLDESQILWDKAKALSGATACYFIAPKRNGGISAPFANFGKINVWKNY